MALSWEDVVGTNRDNDAAKERLVESLSSARDTTMTSVREDIAPAVAAVVEAAIDASGPLYAEAASRAGDAVNAVRSSDTVNSVLNSDRVQSVIATKADKHRRWPFLLAGVGAGAAVFTIVRRRNSRDELIDLTESSPAPSYDEASDPSAADLGPDSA
jgi:hypothetical protein